jgi:hypothetical protein
MRRYIVEFGLFKLIASNIVTLHQAAQAVCIVSFLLLLIED